MPINIDLENLYVSWKKPNTQFVSGGVVDEAIYNSSKRKIMMLLKEVNDPNNDQNWSLVDLIRNQINTGKILPTWRNVGVWSYGIQNDLCPYNQIVSGRFTDNIAVGLEYIATTNLKKSGGAGVSNHAVIKEHAEQDKDLWTQEIQIIKPQYVICGGTFSIVEEILGLKVATSPSGAKFGKSLGTIFVDFYHPQYFSVSPKMLYAYFKETMDGI